MLNLLYYVNEKYLPEIGRNREQSITVCDDSGVTLHVIICKYIVQEVRRIQQIFSNQGDLSYKQQS